MLGAVFLHFKKAFDSIYLSLLLEKLDKGSSIGHFLFVLHVNDLPNGIWQCNVSMYADDTVLFCQGGVRLLLKRSLIMKLFHLELDFEMTD